MSNQVQINSKLNCLVFKTNIDEEYKVSQLIYVLEKIEGIEYWNLDMEDWENILRIEFSNFEIEVLTEQLSKFSLEIEELPIW
ncbi:MAG: hypothetical protein BalsKO_19340 [Balneolaceae bacterium]